MISKRCSKKIKEKGDEEMLFAYSLATARHSSCLLVDAFLFKEHVLAYFLDFII